MNDTTTAINEMEAARATYKAELAQAEAAGFDHQIDYHARGAAEIASAGSEWMLGRDNGGRMTEGTYRSETRRWTLALTALRAIVALEPVDDDRDDLAHVAAWEERSKAAVLAVLDTNDDQQVERSAAKRVDGDPVLEAHRDLLVEYDWPNRTEHLLWVATSSARELLAWVETIRRDATTEA